MIHRTRLVSALLVALAAASCSDDRFPRPPSEVEEALTADVARAALVRAVEDADENVHRRDFLRRLLPELKTADAETLDNGSVQIGRWHIDPKAETFSATLEFPNAPRHAFNQWSGEFRRAPDGSWRAAFTDGASSL
jgi:hypothetical protein